jgi:hypothetical protein
MGKSQAQLDLQDVSRNHKICWRLPTLSDTASAYPLRWKGTLIAAGRARRAVRAIRREFMAGWGVNWRSIGIGVVVSSGELWSSARRICLSRSVTWCRLVIIDLFSNFKTEIVPFSTFIVRKCERCYMRVRYSILDEVERLTIDCAFHYASLFPIFVCGLWKQWTYLRKSGEVMILVSPSFSSKATSKNYASYLALHAFRHCNRLLFYFIFHFQSSKSSFKSHSWAFGLRAVKESHFWFHHQFNWQSPKISSSRILPPGGLGKDEIPVFLWQTLWCEIDGAPSGCWSIFPKWLLI